MTVHTEKTTTMKTPTTLARRKKQPAAAIPNRTPLPPADDARSASRQFPIVGIGASAGGLEALDLFLRNVPEGSGMAFVIVQHLDPTHKGMMAELLQRVTAMKVMQVKDRTRVQPDCVYVIPPNKDMSILHGVLHLLDPVMPRGRRLPIDFFLSSHAFQEALRLKDAVTRKNVKVGSTGGVQAVDLTVQAIAEPQALRGLVMIVFTEVATPHETTEPAKGPHASSARGAALKRDLEKIRQELRSTREEMQTSQEEAKSTNEELQSTNEELQSTNEELTTSKEEMQSMNEELQTLNAELQQTADDLSRLNGRTGVGGPAVILLDIGLPRVNGLDVLQRLRADPRTRLIPVVLLTSSDEERDLLRGYEHGANSFVCKPLDSREFAERIARLGVYWLAVNEPPPARGHNG
jgi:chemotaxis response regulator CheB